MVYQLHKEWEPLFAENASLIRNILAEIGPETCPPQERIFTFAQSPLSRIRVIILGQDPYPQPGAATGRAFEVGFLRSWSEPFRQVSLRNIMRAIYMAYSPEKENISYGALLSKIEDGSFPILPPHQLFRSWDEQGVLLLNTALSCLPWKSGSQMQLWQPFTLKILEFLGQNTDAAWFLWGSHAKSYLPYIKGKTYCSRHPMMCDDRYPDDYLKNPCFRETKKEISWTGLPPAE